MTPTELREARRKLGLGTGKLAKALRMGEHGARTIRRWEAGAPIPGMAAVAIQLMLERHSEHTRAPHCADSHTALNE
jgi:DNA-binding transcriptional regulator YiaG